MHDVELMSAPSPEEKTKLSRRLFAELNAQVFQQDSHLRNDTRKSLSVYISMFFWPNLVLIRIFEPGTFQYNARL